MHDRSDHFGRQVNARMNAAPAMAVIAFAILAILPLGGRAAFGQCSYEVTAIVQGPPCWPGNNPTPLIPRGLNVHGEIVGDYADCLTGGVRHPFFWSLDTGLITLPVPDGVYTAHANDISDGRLIVGDHLYSGIGWRGYIYDMQTQTYTNLEPKHGVGSSWANTLNNAGVVAGARSFTKSGTNPYNAVIWRPFEDGSPVEDLGVMGVGPNSSALDVDEEGEMVVGWTGSTLTSGHAFVWSEGSWEVIGPLPNGTTSNAGGLNDKGFVVGSGRVQTDSGTPLRGFIWHKGQFTIVEPPPPFDSAGADQISNHCQVLILCSVTGGMQRPYLWQHGQMFDLNDLVEDSAPTLTRTSDINDMGQILVRAGTRAVLLTPVGVPFADLNFDCRVDYHDLLIMFEQWGAVARGVRQARGKNGVPSADLNGDGVVNVTDLLILFDNWG